MGIACGFMVDMVVDMVWSISVKERKIKYLSVGSQKEITERSNEGNMNNLEEAKLLDNVDPNQGD